jgi:subtilisin family serine protease
VDAVSMSFGYYHEDSDAAKTASLYNALRSLVDEKGRDGRAVVLVASAGNDATDRPMLPAAFTDIDELTSVGARNPNGTVALFSNAGTWVDTYWTGAQVFSTMPDTFNGAVQPTARTTWNGQRRESLDLDDFTGGFATWSGTSFATPAFLGHCLQLNLTEQPAADLLDIVRDVAKQHRR